MQLISNGCDIVQLRKQRPIYTTGCSYPLLMWIEDKLDIVGAIALGFAILHVSFQHSTLLTLNNMQTDGHSRQMSTIITHNSACC